MPDSAKVTVTVTPRVPGGALFPEQSAIFDLVLSNTSAEAANLPDFDSNRWTPVYRIFNSAGERLLELTISDLYARFGAEMGEPDPEPPHLTPVPANGTIKSWLDLWSFTPPLPKGDYSLVLHHVLDPETNEAVDSAPVLFSVVDADVQEAVLSYEDQKLETSVLAWLAAPREGGDPEILVRLSALNNHRSAQRSGNAFGKTPTGSKLALSAKPREGTPTDQGWLAVISGNSVTLFYMNRAAEVWKSDAVTVPFVQPLPVPGFPDRNHCVFLASGLLSDGSSALLGLTSPKSEAPEEVVDRAPGPRRPRPAASNPAPAIKPWVLPLQANPTVTACAVTATGPIPLLLATETATETTLFRLDILETGTAEAPERVAHSSPHRLLALLPNRPSAPPGFLAVLADREKHDQLTVVRIPVTGDAEVVELPPTAGWPTVDELPLAPLHFQVAYVTNDQAVFAFLDERGNYYAGSLDGSPVALIAPGGFPPRITLPHIAALHQRLTFAGFSDLGSLIYLVGR